MLGAEPGWRCFFAGAEELLEDIKQSQAQLEQWQVEKTEAALAKEQLQSTLVEEFGMARKRSRPSHNIQQAREEQLKHELKANLHSLQPAAHGKPLAGRLCAVLITARSSPDMSGLMNAACGMKGPTSAATALVVWY